MTRVFKCYEKHKEKVAYIAAALAVVLPAYCGKLKVVVDCRPTSLLRAVPVCCILGVLIAAPLVSCRPSERRTLKHICEIRILALRPYGRRVNRGECKRISHRNSQIFRGLRTFNKTTPCIVGCMIVGCSAGSSSRPRLVQQSCQGGRVRLHRPFIFLQRRLAFPGGNHHHNLWVHHSHSVANSGLILLNPSSVVGQISG